MSVLKLLTCALLITLVCGCANLKDKEVNGGFQATALVVEGTPGDPSTGSGPSGKVIYGDNGMWFHDSPSKPGSIWAYHWMSYAWLPALFGNNTVSSEVIIVTYGGDGTTANADTSLAAKGMMQTFLGMAVTQKATTVIKTPSQTITTNQDGQTTITPTPPVAPVAPALKAVVK